MFRRLKNKISDYRFNKRMARQRYKRGFSDNDCWGMNYWLVDTFPKMFITLRDMKHGAPELPFEEYNKLPGPWRYEYKRQYREKCKKEGYEYEEDTIFEKWFVILSRIAYCLEQANEDLELENQYRKEYFKKLWEEEEKEDKNFKYWWNKHFEKIHGGYVLRTLPVDKELENKYYKREEEIWSYKQKMKDEAMDLIKKYFYHLWD